jgi:RNA polymerase sigma-70 factor (ECF subfamily)
MDDVQQAVEAVARSSYGRLVAYLSTRTSDVAAAEDALSEALVSALATWPRDGIPAEPVAWLQVAARNRIVDQARSARRHDRHADTLRWLAENTAQEGGDGDPPDRRLELCFVCAHPAIDRALHTPLMLQTVLGLDAACIARAFLVAPTTMGQRLVRAKTKIREAGIPFEVPDERELPERLDAVLQAIYAAYGLGWDEAAGADPSARELTEEALWLARVLRQRLPEEPDVQGLLAVMLFCDARRGARRTRDGRYVPLSDQDPAAWNATTIEEAERELLAASKRGRVGRFQLEAAIQSVHAERRISGRTDWVAVARFYELLVQLAPTLGTRIGRAAAIGEARGPLDALTALDEIDPASAATYQPYWAVRAHFLGRCGRRREAATALERAIALTADPAVRQFLLARHG